jgi:uncharacterized protein YjbI with pentapeptide repeats
LIVANAEQLAKLIEGVEAWNQWRASREFAPDLRGAALSAMDLSGVNLRGADLRGAGFNKTGLSGASLREADLQGVDLSTNRGLQTEQLAGADLTGAKLPEELTKLYDRLENVNNISESARKLFLAVLAACLYSWLTIATTTDVSLITNRASSPLPIIQTSIPIVGFYWVAPLLLLCVYFYLHFYLQKLWEELGSLPAIFPDGRPLHTKTDPWLLNDLVRAHLPKLSAGRPFLSYLQLWISVLLAWWVVPITMFLFWGRYLPRHELSGTTFQVVLLAISVAAALRLYWLAVATLRGVERGPFKFSRLSANSRGYQAAALVVAVGALFAIVSWGAIMGVPSNDPILGIPLLLHRDDAPSLSGADIGMLPHRERSYEQARARFPRRLTWVPRLMALVGYSPFADLRGAELSQKKSGWSKNDKGIDSVVGAQLKGANLRYALASGAFLAGANLSGAKLRGADLSGAVVYGSDLRAVDLSATSLGGADLSAANLSGADLSAADLGNADLSGAEVGNKDMVEGGTTHLEMANLHFANLNGADLVGANLRGAILVSAGMGDTDLTYADLTDVDLSLANLWRARLDGADLNGAYLDNADLTYSDFRGAKNLDLGAVKGASHWDRAFYNDRHSAEESEKFDKAFGRHTNPEPDPDKILKALGLPLDHNYILAERWKKEQALQQKQNGGQTAPKPTARRHS